MNERRQKTLGFVSAQCFVEGVAGAYLYSTACSEPTLYSSTYAAMTRSLYGELNRMEDGVRIDWAGYINSFQDDDGLYRDPAIWDQGWYAGDPLWCGRSHLTCHVVTALACLGGSAPKPMTFLDPWRDADRMRKWLGERDWGERVAWTGNEIMNIGTLLQYARDFHNDNAAGRAVSAMLDWLAENHIGAETGIWGDLDVTDPVQRSQAVQAAYHWWPLFFYDDRPIPHIERAIDTVLSTQNAAGGFGWNAPSSSERPPSSACEDIDSIDPLCRMMQRTDYRCDDIETALRHAAKWVLTNQMGDGGFVFVLDQPFEYGHPQLRGETNRGAMFPTWFRTLSLALIGKALPNHPLGQIRWTFTQCPGMQFWCGTMEEEDG
ncbi:MAG: hypothetical protein KAI66_23250 [Lentisphaeria bacterium]|nr:hypothetical protein [Lentisphaeria bacterium]